MTMHRFDLDPLSAIDVDDDFGYPTGLALRNAHDDLLILACPDLATATRLVQAAQALRTRLLLERPHPARPAVTS